MGKVTDLYRYHAVSGRWAGLFAFSPEEGTAALTLDRTVDDETIQERLRECSEIQDPITAALRDSLVGLVSQVLIDSTEGADAVGRTHREAPEIDGVIRVSEAFARPGALITVRIREAIGPDLIADPVRAGVSS